MDYEKSAFLSDIHIPYEDKTAVKVALAFLGAFKPAQVFLLGDILDCYQLSKFDKDPSRITKIQEDLDDTKIFLAELRRVVPKAEIVYFEGNHEYRLTRYLWQHPEIAGLSVLSMPHLLDLSRFKISFVPITEEYEFHGFLLEHGDIVRKHSGYTARGQMEKRGVSGISGHSHRLGTHYLTNKGGDFVWVENGCLCDRNPEYVKRPNWQNGLSVGYFKKNNHRFAVEQVVITGGKAVYAGREYLPRTFGE